MHNVKNRWADEILFNTDKTILLLTEQRRSVEFVCMFTLPQFASIGPGQLMKLSFDVTHASITCDFIREQRQSPVNFWFFNEFDLKRNVEEASYLSEMDTDNWTAFATSHLSSSIKP